MKALTSILVVVDRGPAAADAVAKAVHLAESFDAKVELFMCDGERAYALSQAYVPTGVEEARRSCIESAHLHLDGLRSSVGATQVPISVDAQCESPLYESIVRKVVREKPDLVIKCAAATSGRTKVGFDATDWQLMRTCPAALMLTRGRRWRELPRFAAAIDVSGTESAGLARDILEAAHLLTGCSGGELDVLYAESPDLADAEREAGAHALDELVGTVSGSGSAVHILAGNPEVSLPVFAKRHAYDAMFLGALTHRPGLTAQVGTLTSRLVEALECDFILVKPGAYRSPIGASSTRVRASSAFRHPLNSNS
jgi:universal stress protein E